MKKNKSIDFKGTVATVSTLTVSLRSTDIAALQEDLAALCGETPDFFNEDLAIVDAAALPDRGAGLDWPALVALLRGVRLNPVAVRHADPGAETAIRRAGLNLAEEIEVAPRKPAAEAAVQETPVTVAPTDRALTAETVATPAQPELDLGNPPPANATAVAAAAAPPPPIVVQVPMPTMVIDRPLRSGQQVYARNADLVVLAMVNPGAEVMADGNIHVYAPLRGRALAGASGNTKARILTTCFEAELVSVGGVYRPLEPGMPKEVTGKPAQVRLVDGSQEQQTLVIEALKIV